MPSENQEFILEFVAESREHLDTAEGCLLRLTKSDADNDAVQACFRALHTVKGGAGFMGLDDIQGLAHKAEQLLDAIREGLAKASAPVCDALLAAVSRLRELVDAAADGTQPQGDDQALAKRLEALLPSAAQHEYAPSAASVNRPATEISSPPKADLDLLIGELLSIDPANTTAMRQSIERLSATAQACGWRDIAQQAIARMSGHLSSLGDPVERPMAHAAILAEAELLPQAVIPPPVLSAAAATSTITSSDRSILGDFIAETGDLLSQAEAVLLASPTPDQAQVGELFRCFHTAKGMAAYLGHPRIELLAHAIESRLTAARDGTETFAAEHHQVALAGIDGLRALVSVIAAGSRDAGPWPSAAASCARMLGLSVGDSGSGESLLPPEVPRLGDLLIETGAVTREQVEAAAAKLKPGERLGDKLVESGVIKRETVDQAAAKQAEIAAKAQGDGFARVSITRLEELVTLVGELLIAQAMVGQEPEVLTSSRLGAAVGRQARVVRSLQSLALGLRLVPLRATFQKMSRAVHDTARKLGKQIDFQLVGEDVEVDRTLAEAIADPLLHMVRNAVDHGIESPEGRVACGKPPMGFVLLSAAHSGDHVVVQLCDDGKGLDPARLAAKAKEKGLISADANLSASEAYQLIFLPGFSTAEKVTAVSGRGVGMDVVKRNIERVKGKVEISSFLGQGTTFTIRLPLTTAILDAMVLRVGDQRFLVPITSVIEAVRPELGQVAEVLGRGRVIEARGQLVPVVHLGEMFGISASESDATRSVLLILEREGGRIALQVDEIVGLQQVVIKPLNDQPHHAGIAGSAIMGDGRIGLIIDPLHLLAA